MKKIIASILALSTVATMAVPVFAQTSSETTTPEASTSNRITYEKDVDGLDLGSNAVLLPGRTYYFPLKYIAEGETEFQDFTADQYKNYKFSFANEEGKRTIESMKVEKHRSLYSLAITTKAGWPTELEDVRFRMTVVDTKDTSKSIQLDDLAFQVGYPHIAEDALTSPDYVVVNPAAPVITEDQFADLNERNDGESVTFAYGDWEFSVRVKNLKDLNLVSNQDEIELIVDKFQDQEFKFVSFPAGPEFRTEGKLSINVASEMEDFDGKFFVYRYMNGKLTKLNATLDSDNDLLTLDTKQLGRFVVTNKEITDNTIVDDSFNGGSNSGSGSNGGSNNGSGEPNPDTGANDFVGLAVALSATAAAGIALASKKNRK